MILKAFVSYAVVDKHVAGKVKDNLEVNRVETFVAHDDIHVSEQWRDRILQELGYANIFIPVLSAAFKSSDWAPQEIGVIITRPEVLIIPLSVDGTNPFGFIANIQGKGLPKDDNYHEVLIRPILDRFPHGIIPGLIHRLYEVGGFRWAEALMSYLIPYIVQFNDAEVEAFIDASIQNNQIWDAGDCATKYLPMFLRIHGSRIAPEKLEKIQYQIQHRKPFSMRDKQ